VFLKTTIGHFRYGTPKNAIAERNNLISFLHLEKSKIGFSQSQLHFQETSLTSVTLKWCNSQFVARGECHQWLPKLAGRVQDFEAKGSTSDTV
jgi:hypothetical protein